MNAATRSFASSTLAILLLVGCGDRKPVTPTVNASSTEVDGRKVLIEVFNVTKQPGLARTATLRLRAQSGLDVVFFGTLTDTVLAHRERGLIYVRRGDTSGVGRVIAAIGDAEVVDRADPTRLVDLSVFPGRNFPGARAH